MVKRIILTLALTVAALAQVTLSPASATSGLSWSAPPLGCISGCYTPTTVTASGGTAPYSWAIEDSNGDALGTMSASAGALITVFGEVNCAGSSTNTICAVSAPTEYPSGPDMQIVVTDSASHSATFTMNFSYGSLPAAYMQARARWLARDNAPMAIWLQSSSPNIYQPWGVIFPNLNSPGQWVQLPYTLNVEAQAPVTAGSDISRPTLSYDGKWTDNYGSLCAGGFCANGQEFHWDYLTTGGAAQPNGPVGARPEWDYYTPDRFVTITPSGSTQQIQFVNMANAQAVTTLGTFTDTNGVGLFSQASQTSLFPIGEGNFSSGCVPTTNCSVGGQGPEVFTYNLASCEVASPPANCATLVAQFNFNLVITNAYTDGGVAHSIPDEYHVHDDYQLRGFPSTIITNYGPHSDPGEGLYLSMPDNATSGSQVSQYYAIQNPTINLAYQSHPGFGWNGYIIVGGGSAQYCNDPDYPTSQACNYTGSQGTAYWDTRLEGHCSVPATFPDANCGLVQWDTTSVGHTAYDGFALNYVGHDTTTSTTEQKFYEASWNPNYVNESVIYDWGPRPVDTDGDSAVAFLYGPSQSPDADKYTEVMLDSMSQPPGWAASTLYPTGTVLNLGNSCFVLATTGGTSGSAAPTCPTLYNTTVTDGGVTWLFTSTVQNYYLPWMFDVRPPAAPILVSLGSTSAAKVQWMPAPLNHEAEEYWVWKQPSCSGAWTRLASVSASYSNNISASPTAYSYTDSTLGSGSTACYGVTTTEWAAQESRVMSNQVGITNTSGVFSASSHVAAGTVNFDSAPNPVSGFTATSEALCATICASVGTPTAPTLTPGTGGSLASGTYQVQITYFKCKDAPACNTPVETLPNATPVSASVSASGTLTIDPKASEMVGQDGYRIYVEQPGGSSLTLRSTVMLPDCGNLNLGPGTGGYCYSADYPTTYSTLPTAGANPPVTNSALGGYTLAWTNPADPDLSYVLLLENEGSAPSASNPWPYEIAADPAGATSWYFGFANQNPQAHVYFAAETIDGQGRLSSCVAYDATAGSSVSCSQ